MAQCLINDRPYSCLLDSGSQANVITENVMEELGLELIEETPFNVVGTGNNRVVYLGITQATLKFPSIKAYDRVEPFLVIPRDDTADALHVQIGTNPIDLAIELMTESELQPKEAAWNRCKFSAVASALYKSQQIDSKRTNPLEMTFHVKTREAHTIPAGMSIVVNARTDAKWVGQTINVITLPREVMKGLNLKQSYTSISGGTGNLDVVLENTTDHPIKILKKHFLGHCQAANLIPTPEYHEKADHLDVKIVSKSASK